MSDLLIRKGKVSDLPAIQALIGSGMKHGKILKRSRPDIRKAIRNFWLADEGGKIVGCCSLDIYSRKLAEVRSLVVHEHRRKQGIASLLIDQCIRTARKKKIYELLAITDRETLFKRAGFSEQLHGQKALFSRP